MPVICKHDYNNAHLIIRGVYNLLIIQQLVSVPLVSKLIKSNTEHVSCESFL